MVVNLEPSNEDGSHWIGLYTKSPDQIFYFDSYGMVPDDLVEEYLKENFKRITINTIRFQSHFSSVCGHYCIYLIYKMSSGSSFNDLIRILKKSDNPDTFVKNFVTLLCI